MARRHAAVAFTPAGLDRAGRRRLAAARRTVQAGGGRSLDEAPEVDVVPLPSPTFGRTGRPGPASLRRLGQFRVPAHRATSAVVSRAYPFLAEAGLGGEGTFVGRDVHAGGAFCFDPWVLYARELLTNPNVLIAGEVGSGKSSLAKSLATRSIAAGRRVYVPGDPKGEWTQVARTVGGAAITLAAGSGHRLNPLDPGPRPAGGSSDDWEALVRARRLSLLVALVATVLERPLGPMEHTAVSTALDTATRAAATNGRPPVLPDVAEALFAPDPESTGALGMTVEEMARDGRPVGHALRRMVTGDLAGLFDGPSTVTFDPDLPMVSIDLSGLRQASALAVAMTCAASWMEAAIADPAGGQRWIVYDEGWQLLRHPALLDRMQEQWKLSRAWGLANLLVMHRLSDLDAVGADGSKERALALGLMADCSTRVMYRQEPDQRASTAEALDLTDVEVDLIGRLDQGVGLWKVRGRSFVVHHQLTPDELALFDTNSRMSEATTAAPSTETRVSDVRCEVCTSPIAAGDELCGRCGSDRRLVLGQVPTWHPDHTSQEDLS